jgi:hypothetical protein
VSSVVNRFVNGGIQIGVRNSLGPFGGFIDPFCELPGAKGDGRKGTSMIGICQGKTEISLDA